MKQVRVLAFYVLNILFVIMYTVGTEYDCDYINYDNYNQRVCECELILLKFGVPKSTKNPYNFVISVRPHNSICTKKLQFDMTYISYGDKMVNKILNHFFQDTSSTRKAGCLFFPHVFHVVYFWLMLENVL